jgi:hypothetical protein
VTALGVVKTQYFSDLVGAVDVTTSYCNDFVAVLKK